MKGTANFRYVLPGCPGVLTVDKMVVRWYDITVAGYG